MVSGLICRAGKLSREGDEQRDRLSRSADSSPRKCRSSSRSTNKNPYSNRGLDKFSALLAEIEEKRQQIYSQVDPKDISYVRFVYAGDHDFKPIVVKSKPKVTTDQSNKQVPNVKLSKLSSSSATVVKENERKTENNTKKAKKPVFYRDFGAYQWKDPRFYLPIIVVLILVFLVMYGRSFAIMCTSLGWYVIPTITNSSANSLTSSLKTANKTKDYAVRRLSNKKLLATSEGIKSFKGVGRKSEQHRKSM